jgi:hypothetical protein
MKQHSNSRQNIGQYSKILISKYNKSQGWFNQMETTKKYLEFFKNSLYKM